MKFTFLIKVFFALSTIQFSPLLSWTIFRFIPKDNLLAARYERNALHAWQPRSLGFRCDKFSNHRTVLVARNCKQYSTACQNIDACRRMQTPRHYKTSMSVPQCSLFEVFSIDFEGSFPESSAGHRYLLICVEQLTGWPILAATQRATAQTVVKFLTEKIIPPFGAPGAVVSDNATSFTA